MIAIARAAPLQQPLPPGEQETFDRWATEIFGNTPTSLQFVWDSGGVYRVIVRDGPAPVCSLKIFDRSVQIDGIATRIGGVGQVMTPPEHRRRGFAALALAEAKRTIFETMGAPLGMLFCQADMVPYYSRRGWQALSCPVWIDHPSGKVVWPHWAMILARPGESWAPQSIDACGLPW
jgi:hypothetical protein